MNQDVDGNRKLFWKEVNEGKEESCSRIKDGKGRIKPGADEVQRIWKDYFEDLHNIDIQEQVAVHMCGFHHIQRVNYFRREPIRRTEVEVRVGKLKNGKAISKDEVTGEIVKGGGLHLETV